jgi:uncharacterized protein (UPF0264 family)
VTHRAVKLLVSVRDADEAAAAIAGGADIIDAKEPRRGSLGRVDPETLRGIVERVAGQRPLSAALGEWDESSTLEFPSGLTYVKVGLARASGANWAHALSRRYANANGAAAIAVAYADHARAGAPPAREVLDWAIQHRAAGLLIDTYLKDLRGLFAFLEPAELSRLISKSRQAGLRVALAGSLKGRSLERALALEPDILAVRGAACFAADRESRIEEQRVRALANLIEAHNAPKAAPSS